MMWASVDGDYHSYIQNYWKNHVFPMQGKYMGFGEFWNHSLHDGAIHFNPKTSSQEKGDADAIAEGVENMNGADSAKAMPVVVKEEKKGKDKKAK